MSRQPHIVHFQWIANNDVLDETDKSFINRCWSSPVRIVSARRETLVSALPIMTKQVPPNYNTVNIRSSFFTPQARPLRAFRKQRPASSTRQFKTTYDLA